MEPFQGDFALRDPQPGPHWGERWAPGPDEMGSPHRRKQRTKGRWEARGLPRPRCPGDAAPPTRAPQPLRAYGQRSEARVATPSRVGSGPPCRRRLTLFGGVSFPCPEPSPSLGPRIWGMGRPGGLPGATEFPLVVRHPTGPATGSSRARDFSPWIRFRSSARGRLGLASSP